VVSALTCEETMNGLTPEQVIHTVVSNMHLTSTTTADSSPDTKSRLLEAAGQVFADVGFKTATIREICQRASANVAAVNYHFGDKEGLYRAVLDYSAKCALEKYPIGGGDHPSLSAREKLPLFVRTYLRRLLDEGRPAWHGMLIAREMIEPTQALSVLADTFARPQYQRLSGMLAELLGPGAVPEDIRRCAASVVGQCLFYKHCRPMINILMPEQGYDEASISVLARHITEFSLGAIESIRAARAASKGGAS
jgi:TetR/AcrR family transcriptional regulator, regulator of cefoperazone and chloramphenicol sensitivity